MILNSSLIDDWIFCPYLFGTNTINKKINIKKKSDSASQFKDFIIEMASYELRNMFKYNLYDYRNKYSTKFLIKRFKTILENQYDILVEQKNKMLNIFSNNIFVGYNIPIDIAVPDTSIIFRSIVDFCLTDEDKNIIVANIENISSKEDFIKRMHEWPHHHIQYSHLSYIFDKKITVYHIDHVNDILIEDVYMPSMYNQDLEDLKKIILGIHSGVLYKNLYQCDRCFAFAECK